jgi:hypothetical protein
MCFLAIWTSSFEKALFSSFALFFIASLTLGSLVFWAPCIFWLLIPCQMYSVLVFGKDFLPFCGLILQFGDHFFCCAETF